MPNTYTLLLLLLITEEEEEFVVAVAAAAGGGGAWNNGGMGRLPMDVALQGASNAVRVHLKDDGGNDFMNVNGMSFAIKMGGGSLACVNLSWNLFLFLFLFLFVCLYLCYNNFVLSCYEYRVCVIFFREKAHSGRFFCKKHTLADFQMTFVFAVY